MVGLTVDHCTLVGADLYGSRLSHLHLFDSDLTDAQFSQVRLTDGRLHGSKLERVRGAEYLSGVAIEPAQVLPMAMQVLSALGVRVDDDREGAPA